VGTTRDDGRRTTPFVDLLELAIEHANDGIAIMAFTGNADVPVRIVFANAAVERLSGFSRRELLEPSNPFLRVQPQHRERYEAMFERVRAGESVLFEIELGGRERTTRCEIRWSPLAMATGTVTHYVAVIREIDAGGRAERTAPPRGSEL
jgi:PAS domain S-box-containing protein